MDIIRQTLGRFRKGTTDHDGDGKMGGSLKESAMSKAPTKKPSAKKALAHKAAAKTTAKVHKTEAERDAVEQDAYDRGRHARQVHIARDQAPFGKSDNLLPHWQAGWDFEDGNRGDTVGPVDTASEPTGGVGQVETASGAKKA